MVTIDPSPLVRDKIHVLHICETARGGVGTYINTLLSSNNIEQEVVAPASDLNMLTNQAIKHTFVRTGRNFASLMRFVAKSISVVWRSDVDVVFCHSTFSMAAMLALRLVKPKVPIIYCAHGWASTRETKGVINSFVILAESFLTFIPTVNVSVSHSELAHAKRHGFFGKHIVIENGVRSAIEPLSNTLPSKDKGIEVLFVGRHDRQKGLDLLLAAFSEVRAKRADIKLRVVGAPVVDTGPNSSGNQDGVVYTGWASDSEIDQIYRDADVCIVPSRWEAFGLVAAEAYRNGCPVIVSDRGALPDMVVRGQTGYIMKLSTENIAVQLLSIKKEDLQRMRSDCIKLYNNRFTVERLVSQIEATYLDIL